MPMLIKCLYFGTFIVIKCNKQWKTSKIDSEQQNILHIKLEIPAHKFHSNANTLSQHRAPNDTNADDNGISILLATKKSSCPDPECSNKLTNINELKIAYMLLMYG